MYFLLNWKIIYSNEKMVLYIQPVAREEFIRPVDYRAFKRMLLCMVTDLSVEMNIRPSLMAVPLPEHTALRTFEKSKSCRD
jgi:hypothetical protein